MRVSDDVSRAGGGYRATDQLGPRDADQYDNDYDNDYDDEYDDGDVVYYEESTRWRWIAAVAGAVLVLAIIGTVVILRGGDSATTTGRIQPSLAAPTGTRSSAKPAPPVATTPRTSLPPETMTTVTPSATTPTETLPPPPGIDPRTITYSVSGTRQPGDFVTVTYIDGNGAPRTDFNVALPWTATVAPTGGDMLVKSVTAVSLASHLNCSITDVNGQPVASQNFNTIATTCNR
jgi:hypothetical protein